MSKHTPGPWVRDQYGHIKANGETLRVNGVSLPCGGRPADFGEVDANSNLIAAAPDLLAVLKELEECAGYWSEYDVPLGIVDRIRAAIAKAEAV